MSAINKNSYYAKIKKALAKYNYNIEDFKENPICLFLKDKSFRHYVYETFKPFKRITWYKKPYQWSDHIPESFYSIIEVENFDWYAALSAQRDYNFSDNDEDDLFSIEDRPGPSRQTTGNTRSASPGPSNTAEKPPTAGTSSAAATAGAKRKLEPTSDDHTTNVAKKIYDSSTGGPQQEQPTGQGEVDQSRNHQQLQTDRGNLPNQRGTLQGESGNLKIQKPLERFGVLKVNKSCITTYIHNKMYSFKQKTFIFLCNDKTLSNDLIEAMDVAYESGDIATHYIENVDEAIAEKMNGYNYIIGWKLPFNIGYPTLQQKLGTRFNKCITFTRNFENFDDFANIVEHIVIVRFKNNAAMPTLAEVVEKAQQDMNRYNNRQSSENNGEPPCKTRKLFE